MEKWRLYTKKIKKTELLINKGDEIPEGLYHLAVEIWILNDKGELLLLQRAKSKKFHPGEWECLGGSAIEDESFIECAIREVKEEIGIVISKEDLQECGYEIRRKHIVMTYILRRNFNLKDLKIQVTEIEKVGWFTNKEFEELQNQGKFVKFLIRRYQKYIREEVFSSVLKCKPKAILRLTEKQKDIIAPKRGLPSTGNRNDGTDYHEPLKTVNNAFNFYGRELSLQPTEHENYDNNVGGGSPMKTKPFPGVKEAVEILLDSDILSQYPMAAGDIEIRKKVVSYLISEGFSKKLTEDQMIFTSSTTQAFYLLCKLLLRPYDVIIFEAPTYGLYTLMPEREGGITRFIPLTKEENWVINANLLSKMIDEINEELKCRYMNLVGYIPQVVAIYQSNPNNPIGRVISNEDKQKLVDILEVCHEKGVFYIDDILYKDLSFQKDVFCAMMVEGYESDVITLFGVSKAYGLAGMRTGVLVADEIIIRGIRNLLFQQMDSPSHLQAVVLGVIFNNSKERQMKYQEYFEPILAEYKYRYSLLKAGICGIDSIPILEERKIIIDELSAVLEDEYLRANWLKGIKGLDIVDGTEPEAGFFALIDLSSLLGKRIDDTLLETEEDILIYLYQKQKIKYIMGKSIVWPDVSKCIARVSFAAERREIIFFIQCLNEAIVQLSDN